MSILLLLIPLGLVLVGFAAWAFFWAVNNGQFDDLDTPAIAILADEERAVSPRPRQDDDSQARESRAGRT